MKILLNSREEYFEQETLTLSELILMKNYTFKMLVTKINDQLIKKEERDKALIREGDQVVVHHLISGG